MIPKIDCIRGHLYQIKSRNLSLGVYDGDGGFVGIREKFGQKYLFTEYHYDNGPPFGTVTPQEDLGPIPETIPISVNLENEHGADWAQRSAEGGFIPVKRRGPQTGEPPHGNRRGFVDLWADTGERLPDAQYPSLLENRELFNFLSQKETC